MSLHERPATVRLLVVCLVHQDIATEGEMIGGGMSARFGEAASGGRSSDNDDGLSEAGHHGGGGGEESKGADRVDP